MTTRQFDTIWGNAGSGRTITTNVGERHRLRELQQCSHGELCEPPRRMRICLIYDCLFPWTVGGAERWTRNVGEALAAEGHEVTYLTRLQWEPGDEPDIPGIRVVA